MQMCGFLPLIKIDIFRFLHKDFQIFLVDEV